MSGPLHFTFGFGLGLLFWYLSNRKFSSKHVLIFSVSNWFGPDIGTMLWRILEGIGVDEELSHNIGVYLFHYYPSWAIASVFFALFYTLMFHIELTIPKRGKNIFTIQKKSSLSFVQCFKLVTAGGYLHFFVDDALGGKLFYHTLIDWGTDANVTSWEMIFPGLLSFILVYLMIWFLHATYWSPKKQMKNLFGIFFIYTSLILLMLGIAIGITGTTQLIGDENDFGLNIWLLLMFFGPLMLVASSIQPDFLYEKELKEEPQKHSIIREYRAVFLTFLIVFISLMLVVILQPDLLIHLV